METCIVIRYAANISQKTAISNLTVCDASVIQKVETLGRTTTVGRYAQEATPPCELVSVVSAPPCGLDAHLQALSLNVLNYDVHEDLLVLVVLMGAQ